MPNLNNACKLHDSWLLRIKALLRRARIVDEHKITVGDVVVDMDSRTVRRGMEVQTLPPKEFELLYKLLAYPERTFIQARPGVRPGVILDDTARF